MITCERIITIETSGRVGSIAAGYGSQVLAQKTFSDALRHSGELMPTIARLCDELNWKPENIDTIFISIGPGSFTGVRIAATLAKILGFSLSVRVVAVPSLEPLVLNAQEVITQDGLPSHPVAVIIEAGRGQVFSAVYKPVSLWIPGHHGCYAPGYDLLLDEASRKPAELLSACPRPLYILGEGIHYHKKALLEQEGVFPLDSSSYQPQARHVHICGWHRAQAGLFASIEQLVPNYLRRPEALDKWEEIHGKS